MALENLIIDSELKAQRRRLGFHASALRMLDSGRYAFYSELRNPKSKLVSGC
jgi:hypothetical protein